MAFENEALPIIAGVRPLLLPHFGSAEAVNHKQSWDASAVTKLDIEAEDYLKQALGKAFPDIGYVGEEGGGDRSKSRFWLVDPIDGTGNYMRGLPVCTTMVALIEDGEPVFSAIYDFIGDRMYWAKKGGGAFKNKESIRVSDRDIAAAWVGFEINMLESDFVDIFLELYRACNGHIYKTLSSGWEHAMIAEGKLQAHVGFVPFGEDWDFAAGALLVSEAGGKVSNVGSKTYDYRNTNHIAASPNVFNALSVILNNHAHRLRS